MSKPIAILTLLVVLFSCSQPEATTAKPDVSTIKADRIAPEQEKFDSFFDRFDSDSAFQKSRIKFPLKLVSMDETGEKNVESYISETEINHIGVGKLKESQMIFKKRQLSKNKMQIKFQIDDTGYEKDYFFESRFGKWFLVSVADLSD